MAAQEQQVQKQHPIPQQVLGVEFKIIGDLTIKQFVILAVFGLLAVVFFYTPIFIVFRLIICISFALTGIAFAFVPIQDQPLDQWLKAFIKAIYTPTKFVWQKQPEPLEFLVTPIPKLTVVAEEEAVSPEEAREKLQAYLAAVREREVASPIDLAEKQRLEFINLELQEGVVAEAELPPPPPPPPTAPLPARRFEEAEKKPSLASTINYAEPVLKLQRGEQVAYVSALRNVKVGRRLSHAPATDVTFAPAREKVIAPTAEPSFGAPPEPPPPPPVMQIGGTTIKPAPAAGAKSPAPPPGGPVKPVAAGAPPPKPPAPPPPAEAKEEEKPSPPKPPVPSLPKPKPPKPTPPPPAKGGPADRTAPVEEKEKPKPTPPPPVKEEEPKEIAEPEAKSKKEEKAEEPPKKPKPPAEEKEKPVPPPKPPKPVPPPSPIAKATGDVPKLAGPTSPTGEPTPPLAGPTDQAAPAEPIPSVSEPPAPPAVSAAPEPSPPVPIREALKPPPPPVTEPNSITGTVYDEKSKTLEGELVAVKNQEGVTISAVKTNQLGQFTFSSLPNGTYAIELPRAKLPFAIMRVELTGVNVPPLEVRART